MRIIKSKKYMNKEAIWSLPGDPQLPPGVTEKQISDVGAGPEPDAVGNQQGESEINVDWLEFGSWFTEGGEQMPEYMMRRIRPTTVKLTYTYSYDYNSGGVGDIMPIQLDDYDSKQTVADKYFIESFSDYYDEQIKADIKMQQEDSMSERTQPDVSQEYNPDDIPF